MPSHDTRNQQWEKTSTPAYTSKPKCFLCFPKPLDPLVGHHIWLFVFFWMFQSSRVQSSPFVRSISRVPKSHLSLSYCWTSNQNIGGPLCQWIRLCYPYWRISSMSGFASRAGCMWSANGCPSSSELGMFELFYGLGVTVVTYYVITCWGVTGVCIGDFWFVWVWSVNRKCVVIFLLWKNNNYTGWPSKPIPLTSSKARAFPSSFDFSRLWLLFEKFHCGGGG